MCLCKISKLVSLDLRISVTGLIQVIVTDTLKIVSSRQHQWPWKGYSKRSPQTLPFIALISNQPFSLASLLQYIAESIKTLGVYTHQFTPSFFNPLSLLSTLQLMKNSAIIMGNYPILYRLLE